MEDRVTSRTMVLSPLGATPSGGLADGGGALRVKVVLTPALLDVQAGSYYVGAYAIGFREQLFDHFDCVQYCYPPQPGATVVVASSATPAPAVTFDLHATSN